MIGKFALTILHQVRLLSALEVTIAAHSCCAMVTFQRILKQAVLNKATADFHRGNDATLPF